MYNGLNKSDETTTDYFQTTDLGSASAAVAAGFVLRSLIKDVPNRAQFVFDDTPELQATLEKYWSGSLSVDAKTYFETIKWLKTRLYNG